VHPESESWDSVRNLNEIKWLLKELGFEAFKDTTNFDQVRPRGHLGEFFG